jgi:hypothetical protein
MVKKYSIIVVFTLVSLCTSCQRFRVLEVGGETILKNPKYKLEYTLDEKGMQLIDTSAIYVYQNYYFKFYSNGEVIHRSMFYNPPSNKHSLQIHANSVDRGRYELLDDNRIKLELFYPGLPSIYTNGWKRIIRKGVIVGDVIKVKSDHGFIHDYVRQKNWR